METYRLICGLLTETDVAVIVGIVNGGRRCGYYVDFNGDRRSG